MINGLPDATAAVATAQSMPFDYFEVIEPIPWGCFLLLALWLASMIVIVSGIIRGRSRRRRGESKESLSMSSLVISTCVLFLGGGIILWNSASALDVLACGTAPPKIMMQFTVFRISGTLRLLAINSMVAGVGFVAAFLLKDKRSADWRHDTEVTASNLGETQR